MDELGNGQPDDDHGGTGDTYYHPLTAAAITVMHDPVDPQHHHHHNHHHDPHHQQQQHHHHQQQQHHQQQVTLMYDYCKGDPSGEGSPVMGGALECKLTNGLNEDGIGASPTEGLFFVGGAEGVKREPEDLTRRASASPADRGALSDRRRVILPPPPSVPSSGESPPSLEPVVLSLKTGELEHHVIKEELDLGPLDRRSNHALVIQAPLDSGNSDKMSTGAGTYIGGFTSTSPGAPTMYEPVHSYLTSPSPQPYTTSTSPVIRGSPAGAIYSTADPFYRDYYTTVEPQYTTIRQDYAPAPPGTEQAYVLDRYPRPPYKTNGVSGSLTVDLPSPADSGISADAITPRDQPQFAQTFPYDDMTGQIIGQDLHVRPGSPNTRPVSRSWHEFTRHPDDKIQIPKLHMDDDKIHIPKIFSQYGYKYHLETPISTSMRREDDRITYMNKGQFYGITMEYIHDPEKSIKPGTVKTVIMLMFREEKTQEDEIKAWSFWHSRQHSVKQRILDVDTKNSVGLVGQIQEIAHNAIVVYWNPLEQSAKVNVAIQCLSTDFSSQTGVKGLPLHIQVDTYEDSREVSTLIHRGYSQIKIFCDKGAERKTRDEERRAAKRRMAATTRKKYEDLYHQPLDRSEFYSMADLAKPPVLFTPSEDLDKIPMEIQGFYGHDPENGVCGNVDGVPPWAVVDLDSTSPSTHNLSPQQQQVYQSNNAPGRGLSPTHRLDPQPPPPTPPLTQHTNSPTSKYTTLTELLPYTSAPLSPKTNSFRLHYSIKHTNGDLRLPGSPSQQTLDLSSRVNGGMDQLPYWKSDVRKDLVTTFTNGGIDSPMSDVFTHIPKRSRLTPPLSERLMLFVRQNDENVYTPLHLVPPTAQGLQSAIEQKYKISPATIYRKNKCGVLAKVDDEMLRQYTNEDIFMMEVQVVRDDAYEITLIELSPEH